MSLTASNLSFSYKVGEPVLSAVSLELTPSSILAILGPNGCGKSTLIRLLARKLTSNLGKIELDGKPFEQVPLSEFARRVAYVPQSLSTPLELSVEELVRLGRNPHQRWWQTGLCASGQAVVEKCLTQLDLISLRDKKLGMISGGERQRAIIAMALAQEPGYLLLDEPTNGLDFKHQLEVMHILQNLKTAGLGIGIVLHDLNLAQRLADRACLLSKSKDSSLAACGETASVLTPQNLQETFSVAVSKHESATGVYFHLDSQ